MIGIGVSMFFMTLPIESVIHIQISCSIFFVYLQVF